MPKRRSRSQHRGVILLPPEPDHPTWRARFRDPDTGKFKKVRLDPLVLSTAEARRQWAIRKAKALARRKLDLEAGAPRATGKPLSEVLETYFTDHVEISEKTRAMYRGVTTKLLAWCERKGIGKGDDLTGAALVAFNAALVKEPKKVGKKGGRRGEREATATRRSSASINRELRAIGTVLNYCRRAGLLPMLTSDALRDGLKKQRLQHERKDYLRSSEIRQVCEAALRHDANVFKVTRQEHKGLRPLGTTPRYEPIAPFVAFCLLTGARKSESLAVEWSDVLLKDKLILLPASKTKTKRYRDIDLNVSPALAKLLATMKLKCGGQGHLFSMTEDEASDAMERLREYGAPKRFSWQALRRTCETFLVNAPGIFGGASAYRAARQLGHSVAVAERHYVGLEMGIPPEAKTLEAAMQIERELGLVVEAVRARGSERVDVARAAE